LIYFMQPTDGGPVKIGFTDDIATRHRQLEAHYGKPLAILATMEGDRAEEAETHARFAHLRFGRTEQFQPGPDLMAFIDRPLFVNQGDVELMEVKGLVSIATLKGSHEYREWLNSMSKDTLIPVASIVRDAVSKWAVQRGYTAPPEM
jgi:hypothetical protein